MVAHYERDGEIKIGDTALDSSSDAQRAPGADESRMLECGDGRGLFPEDKYKLCYMRGPAGIIVALACSSGDSGVTGRLVGRTVALREHPDAWHHVRHHRSVAR